ncbi:MAG TPA: minichromosome maintenance protein MCM [Candidatus Nanoarchaeia archaeon]|nr:minichromosome maintenance protein MCM [Candidatus Nanoarchaeia archaeon]
MVDAREQIQRFQEFLEVAYLKKIHELVSSGKRSIQVEFPELAKHDPELAEQLIMEPEETIKAAEVALQQFDLPKEEFRVRFINLPESQKIKVRDIRSTHLDNLIMIDGIIRQASDVRPQVISAKFECRSCGNLITVPQLESKFKEPQRCSCGARGRFRVAEKILVDAQRLVIEESPESMQGGEQPKRLSVFVREDLVEPKMEKKTTPGSKVRVVGILKEVPLTAKSGGQLTRYDLALETNSIDSVEQSYDDISITGEDEQRIKELANDPNVYQKLVSSIAPSVYGHDEIKGALVLQLMGGVRKERSDGTSVRGDMHILLVGDPGAAKSTLLTYISKMAPRARYVAGRGASAAGITASVVKDEFMRGWALEAGAIVLASGGILLLDEMDKMSMEDTSALHEAMAQQQVTISKANIQATLTARTTVLAAANPKLGRFDPFQPIGSQINLPPALINRFDLIFPVRDIPDKEKDTKIATHILEGHTSGVKEPEVPVDLMRKYIAYVHQNVFPKLSPGAIEEIKEFYVGLRNSANSGDQGGIKPIPISARQLEALIRLAEGSARVRLSNQVTKKDARNAIKILKFCMMQVGFDYETGQFDMDRIATGVPASTRNKILVIKEIIHELESHGKKTIPIEDIFAEAAEKNLTEPQVEEILEKLKKEGEIYEPKRGWISKL